METSGNGKAHIAVIDDDPRIRSMLRTYLESEQFRVTTMDSAARLRQLDLGEVDLLLLDVGLPDQNGLTIAQTIRAKRNIPIIFISGRSDEVDRVLGLEMGADDYITKPFSLREVLARIRSVLRRARPEDTRGTVQQDGECACFDGWKLDPFKRQLIAPDGSETILTSGEFDLLLAFVRNPRRVLGREMLMELTHGRQWEAFDRAVDAQIARLRRKIEQNAGHPMMIKSIRSHGYMFTPRVDWQ